MHANAERRTIGCLFDGIHGFGRGFAAAGVARAAWTVENADYPRALLKLRVPDAEHLVDVREVSHPPRVWGLTGGFPCQDLSYAGLGAGIAGSRSGLWSEYARIIGEVEPDVVVIENVPALLSRGMDLVVENLVELGYRIEWDCLPAAAFGAPHLRDRVWVVAHRGHAPRVFGDPLALTPRLVGARHGEWRKWPRAGWVDGNPDEVLEPEPLARVADVKRARGPLLPTAVVTDRTGTRNSTVANRGGRGGHGGHGGHTLTDAVTLGFPTPAARDWKDGASTGRMGRGQLPEAVRASLWPTPKASPSGPDYARASRPRSGGDDLATAAARVEKAPPGSGALNPSWVEWLMGFPIGWTDPTVTTEELVEAPWHHGEPDVPRVTSGTPRRKERLTALGNALVPVIPEWIAGRLTR